MNLVNRAFQGIISAGQDFLRQEPRVKFAKITGAAGGALAFYAASCAAIHLACTEPGELDTDEACLLFGKAVLGASMVVAEIVLTERIQDLYESLKNTLKTTPLTIN